MTRRLVYAYDGEKLGRRRVIVEHISIIAGTFSTLIFVSSNLSMLWKAYRTKDLHSYSRLNIILANAGNLIYWIYVLSLPPGPIWLLHLFYTFTSAFMLVLLMRPKKTGVMREPWTIASACLEIYFPGMARGRSNSSKKVAGG